MGNLYLVRTRYPTFVVSILDCTKHILCVNKQMTCQIWQGKEGPVELQQCTPTLIALESHEITIFVIFEPCHSVLLVSCADHTEI